MASACSPITLLCSKNRRIQTLRPVLAKHADSLFSEMVIEAEKALQDGQTYAGIVLDCADRDCRLVKYLVDALRDENEKLIVPDDFNDWNALVEEARYWRLDAIEKQAQSMSPPVPLGPSTIVLAYHGTLTFGKQGFSADVNFRKIHRILVSGKMSECKQIFGDTLNQGRDGDMGEDRYTSRVYLKHTFLEQAFDTLASNGYILTSATSHTPAPNIFSQHKDEQECYMHYSQFTFQKSGINCTPFV